VRREYGPQINHEALEVSAPSPTYTVRFFFLEKQTHSPPARTDAASDLLPRLLQKRNHGNHGGLSSRQTLIRRFVGLPRGSFGVVTTSFVTPTDLPRSVVTSTKLNYVELD